MIFIVLEFSLKGKSILFVVITTSFKVSLCAVFSCAFTDIALKTKANNKVNLIFMNNDFIMMQNS